MNDFIIRSYSEEYLTTILSLMVATVEKVNSKDYNNLQIKAWSKIDVNDLKDSINHGIGLVVKYQNKIVGFANIHHDGYLDHLFVHHDYQRQGIGSMLLDKIEEDFGTNSIIVHSSITAKIFFESKGYHVRAENHVDLRNQKFINYTMTK